MLSVIYVKYDLFWVSFTLSEINAQCNLAVTNAECHFFLIVIYVKYHLNRMSFMLNVIYAESHF